MVDLDNKQWVHHVCVNWHNEIWFDVEDQTLRKYGGKLNYERFQLTCYLCKVKRGSSISCDFFGCTKTFHVRCGIEKRLIKSVEEIESKHKVADWNVKIYCSTHLEKGQKKVKRI